MRFRTLSSLLVGLIALTGACASSSTTEPAATPTTGTTPTSQRPHADPPPAAHRVDWTTGGSEITLANGWRIGPCESGPRQLCVRVDGETVGTIELNDYPLATVPELQRAKAGGAGPDELLRLHVEEFARIFVDERPRGCGPDHVVRPAPSSPASFGGKTGVAYGFDTLRSGKVVERVRNWAVIEGDSLFVLGAAGVEPQSCMDDSELADLDLDQLETLLPVVQAVVGNSPLPKPLMCSRPGVQGAVPC